MDITLKSLLAGCVAAATVSASAVAQNAYVDTILVANDPAYEPLRLVDPLLSNGWGIALRPPGAGGHFWISNANTGTTTTYVGDVRTPTGFLPLFQDSLTVVDIPIGAGTLPDGRPVTEVSIPIGQVFNHSSTDFVVTGEGISAASKFIFVQGDGTIAGWTEQRDQNGVLQRQTRAVITIDNSHLYDDERLQYTGVAVTDFPSGNRLYVANWTAERVEMYDANWQRIPLAADKFYLPTDAEIWRPWNIQYFRSGPNGEGRIWVTYNKAEDPWEEYNEFGAVAEFDLEGNLIRRLTQTMDFDPAADSELRDPWGLAIAPSNFGPFSGMMLVANFGDGTIPAFNLQTGQFVDFLRDANGNKLVVDGIWGITFGNGVALGDSNALYYAAGPNGEADGSFGTVRFLPDTCPVIASGAQNVSVCSANGSAEFTVNAEGPTRQSSRWQVETSPGVWTDLVNGPLAGVGTVAGTDTMQLSVTGIEGGAAFRYVAANICGTSTSGPTYLVFNGAPCCPGDVNRDQSINVNDVTQFLGQFGSSVTPGQGADFNMDGVVDVNDLVALLSAFGGTCGT